MDTIREAVKEDIQGILSIIIDYKEEQNNKLNDVETAKVRDQIHQVLEEKNSKIFVSISSDDEVMGYINTHIISFPLIKGSDMYISDLVVAAQARGNNIGSKLLAFIEKYAKDNSCIRLMLNNEKDMESYTRAFYKKMGFTERVNFANFVKEMK